MKLRGSQGWKEAWVGSSPQPPTKPPTKPLTANNSHHHQHQEAQLVIGFYPNRRIQIGSRAKNCPRSCLGVLCVRLGSPHTRPDREPTLPIPNPFSRPKAVLQKICIVTTCLSSTQNIFLARPAIVGQVAVSTSNSPSPRRLPH